MCAVIGIPSEQWGEACARYHHTQARPDPATKLKFSITAGRRLPAISARGSVEVRQEPLPMSGAGKILKAQLRAPFWVDKTRRVN